MLIRTNGNGQKPHVILLWPKSGLDLGSTVSPPHALLTVAAPLLKAGYSVRLLDQRVERITEETLRPLISSDLMAVGLSTMTGTQVWFMLGLAKTIRTLTDGKVPIILGGCHPSVMPEQTLAHPLVDIVAIGEGDYTLLDIVDALGAHRSLCHVPGIMYKDGPTPVKTLPRPMLNVEELLPTPWELVDPEKYIHRDMYLRDRARVLDIGQTSRGCPFDCVAGDQLFGAADGLFYPEEMADAHNVRCVEGHDHRVGWLGENPIASKGQQECLRILAENGLSIALTANHQIRVLNGERLEWRAAGKIQAGDYVTFDADMNAISERLELAPPVVTERRGHLRQPPKLPALLDEETAWLVGFLIGDGTIPNSKSPTVRFAVTKETELLLREKIRTVFGVTALTLNVATSTQKAWSLVVNSRVIREFFVQRIGINPADKRRVPLAIRRSPTSVVNAFIDGLYWADGSDTRTGHHRIITTTSEWFARELATLCLWIGRGVRLRSQKNGPSQYPTSEPFTWHLSVCEENCWSRPTMQGGQRCSTAVIPIARRYERYKGRFLRCSPKRDQGLSPKRYAKGISRSRLKVVEPRHVLLDRRRIYSRVMSVTPAGILNTWDMSVCPTHEFSAAGISVHNCSFCSSASIRERKWRAQSVDRVMDDLISSVRRFKLDGWWWRDDEFHIKRKRSHAIMEGIIKAGIDGAFYTSGTRCDVFGKATEEEVATMKRAGAYTLKFGAESGSQRILDLMQKGITVEQTLEANRKCARHGITPAFALMIGYPTETFGEIDQTIDLGYRLKRENPRAELETMAQYTPLPGTPDWHLALKHGLQPPQSLEEWANWNFDEFDLDGRKSPWYPRRERRYLGNISYLSILANSLDNVVTSLRNPWIRWPARALVKPASKYFKWRLASHRYRFMPELEAVRILREKIFYKSTFTFE